MSPLSNVKKGYDYKPPPLPSYSPTVTTPIPHHQHHLLHQSVPPLIPEYQPTSDFRPQHAKYQLFCPSFTPGAQKVQHEGRTR